jgi:putative alpha-1,2-mannosidase
MTSFPLYDILCSQITTTKELTVAQKTKIRKSIDNMHDSKHELVYAIIKTYQLNDPSIEDPYLYRVLPYNGVVSATHHIFDNKEYQSVRDGNDGNDVDFNLNSLPLKLKHLLLKFADVHEKSDQ